jgi:hypothetical protein
MNSTVAGYGPGMDKIWRLMGDERIGALFGAAVMS